MISYSLSSLLCSIPLEYDVTSRFSHNLPSLDFADTQNNVNRLNNFIRTNIFKYLNNYLTYQEKNTDNTTTEMAKWYDTSTISNIDRILSIFTQKEKVIYQGIVPLHNNGRFVILDVIIPSTEGTNGKVVIFEYLHKAVNKIT